MFLFCFVAFIVPGLVIESSFRLAALSLSQAPSSYFSSPSLLFGATRCSGFIGQFPALALKSTIPPSGLAPLTG